MVLPHTFFGHMATSRDDPGLTFSLGAMFCPTLRSEVSYITDTLYLTFSMAAKVIYTAFPFLGCRLRFTTCAYKIACCGELIT